MSLKTKYKCKLIDEMGQDDLQFWLNYKDRKFLHNVDTFYYSVKFKNDFRIDTSDEYVKRLRKFFEMKYSFLQRRDDCDELYLKELGKMLYLKPVTFSRFYTVCLSYPEYFDIFLAPVVPKAADGGESVTCEMVVQIRSYMLWQFGMKDCFENSYEYVKKLAAYFHLEIDFVQENRVDYCWHTNYLSNPEEFFKPDNFYRMRVDRFKGATYVTNKVGAAGYEIDYVALGKRSDKVFVRIYQKTREVIEQNYKGWFLQVWEMNGMINRYDKFVYERAYEKKSWFYRWYARLEFYLQHGTDPEELEHVRRILEGEQAIEENDLMKLCNRLTPRLNYVINVEYQTMRRHSKSYELIPFKNHDNKGETKRIYDYIDNRKLIIDYLTEHVFKMVEPCEDPNDKHKYRQPNCAFWEGLRRARCMDLKMTPEEAKLVRKYKRGLDFETQKRRTIRSAVVLGAYAKGINNDNPMQDFLDALCTMNDNDIMNARRYKNKRLRQLNQEELAGVSRLVSSHNYRILDADSGAFVDYDSIISDDWQGGGDFDG